MQITETARITELGTVNETTSFFDTGEEVHTVDVRMGDTTIEIMMVKFSDGRLSNPDIRIHKLRGECNIHTEYDEKISKQTKRLTLDSGKKFKVTTVEVQ